MPLKDVQVFLNEGLLERASPGVLPFSKCFVVRLSEAWNPGQTLDLSNEALFPLVLTSRYELHEWLDTRSMMQQMSGGFDRQFSASELVENLENSSLIGLFPVKPLRESQSATWVRTNATHGYDLSRWFTQPCVIITGRLENVPLPVGLTIDGEAAPTDADHNRGLVLLKWVYPLPARAPTPHADDPADSAGRVGNEPSPPGIAPGSLPPG